MDKDCWGLYNFSPTVFCQVF